MADCVGRAATAFNGEITVWNRSPEPVWHGLFAATIWHYNQNMQNRTSPFELLSDEPRANVAEFTVSELSAQLKKTVEDNFGFVRVRGEISGYRGPHASGHAYFSLKDENARIDAVIWRTAFSRMKVKPEEAGSFDFEAVAFNRVRTQNQGKLAAVW